MMTVYICVIIVQRSVSFVAVISIVQCPAVTGYLQAIYWYWTRDNRLVSPFNKANNNLLHKWCNSWSSAQVSDFMRVALPQEPSTSLPDVLWNTNYP